MDLALLAHNHGVTPAEAGPPVGLSEKEMEFVYRDIEAKRRATGVLHWPGITLEKVEGPLQAPQ